MSKLTSCHLCPRTCKINRNTGKTGFCNLDNRIAVSAICNHKGEEPIINGTKGICNVFFSHCNLQCIYCQNYQISNNKSVVNYKKLTDVVTEIKSVLTLSDNVLGFVSPTSQIPQMISIIESLWKEGIKPVVIYNTNSYDRIESLQSIEKFVDVYLADMRYSLNHLAKAYSDCENYPETAIAAIREMYRQKGSSVLTDKENVIERGLIVRVLCLPHQTDNTINILEMLADEVSTNIHISLLSQYFPPKPDLPYPLNEQLSQHEYDRIVNYALKKGFTKLQTQELASVNYFCPDFSKDNPFI
ncbi:MAG: 4Fe-4S cluster-binding domain-containing protein [Bacteroidales bacterium]|jgi:putative pyruvate formate lyase activating enzyme|nr:4Fe-4S cluster-binding domain-containing protein [Bacteroidales bacterium]